VLSAAGSFIWLLFLPAALEEPTCLLLRCAHGPRNGQAACRRGDQHPSVCAHVSAAPASCPCVQVAVQTRPGFAKGLTDGMPKLIKAEGSGA
jgi:hypothetical protein